LGNETGQTLDEYVTTVLTLRDGKIARLGLSGLLNRKSLKFDSRKRERQEGYVMTTHCGTEPELRASLKV
jgi:hypothetical protein